MKNKAKFKFNNGNLAIICSRCAKIIKVGYEFTELEMMACSGNGLITRSSGGKAIKFQPRYRKLIR